MFIRAFATALLVSSASAPAAPLQPTGKWVADFAENKCLLSRSYGTDEKPLILTFEQVPMDDGMSVYIFKAGGRQDLRAGSAKIAFGATPPADKRFGAYLAADNIRRIEFAIPDNSYLAAKTSETMFVSANGEINETFAVPGFAGALSVLHDCVVDLGKHWGISKEDQNRVRTPAKAVQPLGNYFSTDDYPSDAIKLGGKGRTEVRLAVDSKGKPGDCVVMRPSGNKALDDVTCRVLLRKAHFHPALDLNAQPIDSVTVASVSWVLMDF